MITKFHASTSDEVKGVLQHVLQTDSKIRLFYGDSGGVWMEDNDVMGWVGNSTGTEKIPILLTSRDASGGWCNP